MNLRTIFKPQAVFFVFAGILCTFLTDLYAGDPAVPLIRAYASALVGVQSTGVVGSLEQRTAMIGKATGHLFPADKTRSVNYIRNGSGIILDRRGIIVTNNHIVSNAADISVTLSDGIRVRARLVGALPGNDLAFLSIVPPFALHPVLLADSDKISKEMRVYTVGRSLWHKDTWFRGKITGMMVGRLHGGLHISLLQVVFGMEFYLGDSGSPIFDPQGKLLGIVMAGRRDGDKAVFAITANFIRDALQKIQEKPSQILKTRFETNAAASFLSRMRRISNNPNPLVALP